jgi:glycosyltransferase involved in cell wall biosynthesis
MNIPKIIGITRIRNEENIIKNTLDHVSGLVDEIFVYDDASTDRTVQICKDHPAVNHVIEGKSWDPNPHERNKAEGTLRQQVFEYARDQTNAEWVYYFDADEYAYFDNIDFTADCYYFRLFDFYITDEDKDQHYLQRKWLGPEFRDIPMLFKITPTLLFNQRIPLNKGKSSFGGYVKHYGKAISVEEWDVTCNYYINHRWNGGISPMLLERWKSRIGKSIHSVSDFNRPLIQWQERYDTAKIIKI